MRTIEDRVHPHLTDEDAQALAERVAASMYDSDHASRSLGLRRLCPTSVSPLFIHIAFHRTGDIGSWTGCRTIRTS